MTKQKQPIISSTNYIGRPRNSTKKANINEEPKRPYSQYGPGKEFDGDIIGKVFSAHRDFLIYQTRGSDSVTCYYYDIDTDDYKKNISKIAHKDALLKSCINDKFTRKKFNPRISLAYREAFLGNNTAACNIIDKIIDDTHPFKKNLANIFYLSSCFAIVLAVLLISIFQDLFFKLNYLTPIIKIMLFSSLGGFISVSLSLKKLNLNYDLYNWSQGVYGAIRIITAIISGIIAYSIMKSGFLFSNLVHDNNYTLYSVAVIAGFSEKWIPNTLNNISQRAK